MRTLALLSGLVLGLAFGLGTETHAAEFTAKAGPVASKEATRKATIGGLAIGRPGGGWLGLELVNSSFKLSFYDKDKKPIPVEAARASARWNPSTKTGSMTLILNKAADGLSLQANRAVPPPYAFKLYLTLVNEAGEVMETHVVDFHR